MIPDPLVNHYIGVIELIEAGILNKTPRLMRPARMKLSEVRRLAELLARAHVIHDEQKVSD
jgi:hypothetical protein